MRQAHEKGYKVILLYFWLSSPTLAIQRVAERVSKGGHNIPTDVIIPRYYLGIQNLFKIYMPIVDAWIFADNSALPREIIAQGGALQPVQILNPNIFKTIKDYAN